MPCAKVSHSEVHENQWLLFKNTNSIEEPLCTLHYGWLNIMMHPAWIYYVLSATSGAWAREQTATYIACHGHQCNPMDSYITDSAPNYLQPFTSPLYIIQTCCLYQDTESLN